MNLLGIGWLLVGVLSTSFALGEIVLPVRTSDFTSMVSSIQLGTPAQTMTVGLSFDISGSWFYSSGGCPAFVTCFRSSASESFEFMGQERIVSSGRSTLSGFLVADSLHVGDTTTTEYVQVSHISGDSMHARDVAGHLALGPKSDLGAYYNILVAVDNEVASKNNRATPRWSVKIDPALDALLPGQVEINAKLVPSATSWRFRARVFLGTTKAYNSVEASFVPNVDDVVIPLSQMERVLEMLLVDGARAVTAPDGRLYVECVPGASRANTAQLKRMSFRMMPNMTNFVSILPSALVYTGLVNAQSIFTRVGVRYCPTRIRFSASTTHWLLGFPLAASVDSVLLDSSSKQVTFAISKNSTQRAESVVPELEPTFQLHQIPRFAHPEIAIDGRRLTLEFSTAWAAVGAAKTFALVSKSPEVDGDELVFSFIRVHDGLQPFKTEETRTTPLEGTFQIKTLEAKFSDLDHENKRASFEFVRASDPAARSYEVSIRESANAVDLVLKKVEMLVELVSFEVPPAETAAESEADNCTICMEAIEAGQVVQELPCGDRFHKDCIAGWLGRNAACSNCRAAVPLKPAERVVMTRVAVEAASADEEDSEEEGDEDEQVHSGGAGHEED